MSDDPKPYTGMLWRKADRNVGALIKSRLAQDLARTFDDIAVAKQKLQKPETAT